MLCSVRTMWSSLFSTSFIIYPPDRPQPPASCPVISRISASSLVLSWSGPSYDGGSAILGYVVEVKNQGQTDCGDWSELTSQCKSTSYRVCSGLQQQEEYCFRVRAYNTVGVSEPGPVSPVVKMEQKGKLHELCIQHLTKTNKKNVEANITVPVSLCIVSEKLQEEEAPQAYTCVTINSTHKVTDHYNLQEKLGMWVSLMPKCEPLFSSSAEIYFSGNQKTYLDFKSSLK